MRNTSRAVHDEMMRELCLSVQYGPMIDEERHGRVAAAFGVLLLWPLSIRIRWTPIRAPSYDYLSR